MTNSKTRDEVAAGIARIRRAAAQNRLATRVARKTLERAQQSLRRSREADEPAQEVTPESDEDRD